MNREKIINYEFIEKRIPIYEKNVYKIKPKGKVWGCLLNKFAQFLLKCNIIEEYPNVEVECKRVELKIGDIIDLIYYLREQHCFETGKEPIFLIIGYDKMKELQINPELPSLVYMNTPEIKKIFGMEIVLNPFIDGAFVL